MKTFKVWFDQINQELFIIKAENEKNAIKSAIKEWKKTYGDPYPSYFEEVKD